MITKPPARLTRPSLEAHPFISAVDSLEPIGFMHQVDNTYWVNQEWESSFLANFEEPGFIQIRPIAALEALSNDTLAKLCEILRPKIFDTVILNKDDLWRCAGDNAYRFDGDEDRPDFNNEQLQVYMMVWAKCSSPTRWASIADLYNDSTIDQQAALHGFFYYCRNRDLSWLMEVPSPDLDIPESLLVKFEEKTIDGQLFLRNEADQEWLRDDIHQQQYQVYAVSNATQTFYLLGTAPTIPQAMAKTISFALKGQGDLVPDYITIKHKDQYIVKAVPRAMDKDSSGPSSPMRLEWDMEYRASRIRDQQVKLKSLSDFDDTADPFIVNQIREQASELNQIIADNPAIGREDLRRLVFSVEKAFGLQWAKIIQLEDDLGM